MIPVNQIAVVASTTSVAQARSQMTVLNVNSLLIKPPKGSKVWRVFTTTDLFIALNSYGDINNLSIGNFSTEFQYNASPDWEIERCLKLLVKYGVNHCLVIDNAGDAVGMIGSRNILDFKSNKRGDSKHSIVSDSMNTTSKPSPKLKIFLCHASDDKPIVRILYQKLRKAGFDPWLDEERLTPGQEWSQEIKKAVKESEIILICFSKQSINKSGFVQKEIKYALDIADEQPEGKIFLIPMRLEECELPDRVKRWQWVDGFTESGQKKLFQVLRNRANSNNSPA